MNPKDDKNPSRDISYDLFDAYDILPSKYHDLIRRPSAAEWEANAALRAELDEIDRSLVELFLKRQRFISAHDEALDDSLIFEPQKDWLALRDLEKKVSDSSLRASAEAFYRKLQRLEREIRYHKRLARGRKIPGRELLDAFPRGLRASTQAFDVRRLAFLGAPDSAAETAARFLYPEAKRIAFREMHQAMRMLDREACDLLVVPTDYIDSGMHSYLIERFCREDLFIVNACTVETRYRLMMPRIAKLSSIRKVLGTALSLERYQGFLKRMAWNFGEVATSALAAHEVALRNDPSIAAIAPEDDALILGLSCPETEIDRLSTYRERYIALARKAYISHDANSLILLVETRDQTHALSSILQAISDRGYNVDYLKLQSPALNEPEVDVLLGLQVPFGDERIMDLLYQFQEELSDTHLIGWFKSDDHRR
ncbi:MAG: prephenate dehydratase domain-containing protein [Eubacteriales bacterium]|nr:prephenate dehydratase domain-containing protein [Eubacteriales bacterium]